MKVYIPNRDYLIPQIIDNRSWRDSLREIVYDYPINYQKIFSWGTISKFPEQLPGNYWTNFSLTSNNIGFKVIFADISFDIREEKFDLFWSNFGYVGKVGENIWLIMLPDPTHIFNHMEEPIDFDNNFRYFYSDSAAKAASIEETDGIFAVVVDPYEELSDDLQILLDMLQALTIYGSTDTTNYPYSASYVKSKYKSVYNLLKTTQITQTYEIYSLKCKFYFYQGIDIGYIDGNVSTGVYINGIISVLDEEIPQNFPFKINTIEELSKQIILIGEYCIEYNNETKDDITLNLIFSQNFSFRNSILSHSTPYIRIGQSDWNRNDFFTEFRLDNEENARENSKKFMNCAEIFYCFSVPFSLVPSDVNKSFLYTISIDTSLKSIPALNKLISLEGLFTRYWGGTPRPVLNIPVELIKDLYSPEISPKNSIAFKGFSSQVLLDSDNTINDPAYTDFYFILTPGLNIYQETHREIVSDILTICENREGDCIYLAPIQSFIIEDNGQPKVSDIIPLKDLIAFFETDLIDSKFMATIYPDVFITHPITGDKVVLDTGSTYLIKFGKLDKIYQSPAGSIRGVLDFINSLTLRLSKVDADKIYTNAHVNPVLRPTKYSLPQIEGNRTLYKKGSRVKSALSYVNVRGLLMFLIRVLREILFTFKFEPNDPFLYTRFVSLITPTLNSLVVERALYAYKLKNLTTDDDINKGRFIVGIGIQPTREAEIIEGRIYVFAAGSEIKFE